MDIVIIAMLAMVVVMILAIVGMLVHHNLSYWQANPRAFVDDLKTVAFGAWMIWLVAGFFLTVFMFIAATNQAEFNVGTYIAVSWIGSLMLTVAFFSSE